MEFEIRAKCEQLIDLQNHLKKLKEQLQETDKAADPQAYSALEQQLVSTKQQIGVLEVDVNSFANTMRNGFAESLASAKQQLEQAKVGMEESSKAIREWQKAAEKAEKTYDAAVKAGASSEDLDNLFEPYKKAFIELDKAKAAQAEWTAKLVEAERQTKKFTAAIDDLAGKVPKVVDKTKAAASAITKLGTAFIGAVGVKKFMHDIIDARMELQNMQTSLETMVGKDTASTLYDQLFTIAKKSPLEMSDLMSAEQMMISFGINTKDTVKYLNALSDISMGNAGKFRSLTLAFSQMSATGKLMGQDLNQMINQGFNPLEVMATKTNKSIAQLKDEMSKGKITAEMVQDAFISVTQEGGRFYNMSEAASKTIQGQISIFQDSLSTMYATLGEKLEQPLMDAIKTATYLIDNWQELIPVVLAVAGAIGTAKTALVIHTTWQKAANIQLALNNTLMAQGKAGNIGMAQALGKAIKGLVAQTAAQMGLNTAMAACPYVIIGAAIAGLCYGIYKFATATTAAEDAHNALGEAMAKADSEADEEKHKLDSLAASMAALEGDAEKYASTKAELVKMAKKYNGELADEIEKNGLTAESYTKLSDEIQKHYRTKAYLRWQDSQEQARQEHLQEQMKEIKEREQEYIDKASSEKERLRRVQEVSKANSELSKLAYAGTYQEKGGIYKTISTETYNALKKIQDGSDAHWTSIWGLTQDLLVDASETMDEIYGKADNEGKRHGNSLNLASYGLSQKDLETQAQAERDAEAEEARKKADADKKKQEEAEKKAKEEAAKKAKSLKDYFEDLDKDVRNAETAANDNTLLKELSKIESDYDAKINKVKEKKKELAQAVKDKVVDQKTADEWNVKADNAISSFTDLKASEREKYLKKLNDETMNKGVDDGKDSEVISEKIAADIKAIEEGYDKEIAALEKQKKDMAEAVSAGLIKQEEADAFNVNADAAIGRLSESKIKGVTDYYKKIVESTEKEVLGISEKYAAQRVELAKEFAKKRAEQQAVIDSEDATDEAKEGARKNLGRLDTQEKAEAAKIDLEEFKAGDQYTTIFKDLNKFGQTTLTALKAQLDVLGDSIRQSLDPADAKAFEEQMQQLETRLIELDPFTALGKSRDALSASMERKKKATDEVTAALKEYKSVQAQLEKEEKKEIKDTTKIANLKTRLAKSTEKLETANTELADAENDVAQSSSQSQKAQEKIRATFTELEKNAKAVSEVLGDEVGDVFNFIDSTVQLVDISCQGMEKTSETTSSALKAVETASVILAIIGAAIKVIQILDKFTNGESKAEKAYNKAVETQKEVNKMTDAVNSYREAVIAANQAEKGWFSSSGFDNIKNSWETAQAALEGYNTKLNEQQVTYKNEKGGKSFLTRIANTIKATGGAGVSGAIDYYKERNAEEAITYSSAIDNLRFETQSAKKGGFFKKGRDQKTTDLRTWAKETYGSDLFGEDGMIDVDMAQNIIENYGDKLVGETKETLEKLIEEAEAYQEAMDAMKEQVASWYSPLVDNMNDAIWEWLETGEDALTSFKESASDTFASIAKEFTKMMLNKLIFNKMSEQLDDMTEKYAKGEINEEEMLNQSLDILDSAVATAENTIPTLQTALQQIQERAKESGLDLTGALSSDVEASGGGFETMSEETATELSGRFTALYESGLRQEATLTAISKSTGPLTNFTTLLSITSANLGTLVNQHSAIYITEQNISQCLEQSYLVLQEMNETATKQEKHLAIIKKEITKVREVTDTL